MTPMRIRKHPILPIPEKEAIPFTWNGSRPCPGSTAK